MNNTIAAVISTRIQGVLKAFTQDDKTHYITTDSYLREREKNGDILLSNCTVIEANYLVSA